MRTLNQLSIVQEAAAKFPFGSTVQNETDTQEGTPIVREHYGDIQQNIYKLLKMAKITPTGTEDSNDTQYQLVEALKKLPNSMNDIEQVLTLNDTQWTVNFDLSILPNKYFFFARASDNYDSGATYTFIGTGAEEYGFGSFGFRSGDPLLVIIDTATVRAYPLLSANSLDEVSTTLGSPLSYIDGAKMWYQEDGKLFSDTPNLFDLQTVLQTEYSDATLVLNDMFIVKNKVLCFCFIPSGNQYFFRQFSLSDLTVSHIVPINIELGSADDFVPYVYVYKTAVYMTNAQNTTANDYSFSKFNFNALASTLTYVSDFDLDNTFVKTTNAAIKNGLLYTMIAGALNSFNLTSGAKVSLGDYPSVSGQLFGFNDSIYFGSGEIGRKWF